MGLRGMRSARHVRMETQSQPRNDIVVLGASSGGVEAVRSVLDALSRDLPAALFVVVHRSPEGPPVLARILARTTELEVVEATEHLDIRHGRVVLAAPDRHLVLTANGVQSKHGPKENRSRPAIDPLFRSAARIFGSRVIGVILTGSLDDGTAGMLSIQRRGGTTIVQDPEDALHPSMPRSVLEHVRTDHCVPLRHIAPLIEKLVRGDGDDQEATITKLGKPIERASIERGPPLITRLLER